MIIIKNHYGFGDTVRAITKATGIDKIVGEGCGCNERQEKWNNPDLLINKIFYGTEQDIQVLRKQPEGGREEA